MRVLAHLNFDVQTDVPAEAERLVRELLYDRGIYDDNVVAVEAV